MLSSINMIVLSSFGIAKNNLSDNSMQQQRAVMDRLSIIGKRLHMCSLVNVLGSNSMFVQEQGKALTGNLTVLYDCCTWMALLRTWQFTLLLQLFMLVLLGYRVVVTPVSSAQLARLP